MAEPFLSEIRIMSFGFPPKGWALCDGQLVPINQNQALFSLLGTTYGGDGRVNFALPDLNPYNGVTRFESKALTVELHKDEGVYRYETEIRDHQNQLPDLVPTATFDATGGLHAAADPATVEGVLWLWARQMTH